jgi:membrane peptidoglycan carboxypeptidase
MADSLHAHNSNPEGLRSGGYSSLLAKMAKPKPRNRVKGLASRGFFRRWKWIWIVLGVLLVIPAMQVAAVRFVNPPRTLPMWIEQVSSSRSRVPLRYRWIPLPQIPEMFLKHLWISEDQRFFQHGGVDWKEMDPLKETAAVRSRSRTR